MNQPGENATRVNPQRMKDFVYTAARKADIPENQAKLLSELLIENDLRGVLSHGSRQIGRYVREIQRGGLNPRPNVRIVNETPNSLIVDGDFGLGYFPAYEGTLRAIEKAKEHGMAAMVTRSHGHIGAAGIYARMTLEHDLLTFVTSGVQLDLKPGDHVAQAAGASPIAFSAPTLHEPPLVLDCGVTHDIQFKGIHRDDIARLAPGIILRAIGFGTICQAWGGLLTGLPIHASQAQQNYIYANQGAMLFTFKISLFADPQKFRTEMDDYARQTRTLEPLVNTSGAYLPGGIEAVHEKQYREEGIPLSDVHKDILEKLGNELNLDVPWS